VKSLLVLTIALFAGAAWADPYTVGSTLRPFALEDQHGTRAEVGEGTQLILITRDVDGGDLVKSALENVPQAVLDGRHAVYIADTSDMSAVVARLMAIPKLRQRPYRILLDRNGSATRDFPFAKGTVSLIALDGLRITRVGELTSAEGVRAELGLPPGTGENP
jgi:hypothetical protein